jgi:hypothetical protein
MYGELKINKPLKDNEKEPEKMNVGLHQFSQMPSESYDIGHDYAKYTSSDNTR